jgi:formate-dependent nitrite reductase membrane component NrfD/ferredoxin
MYQRDDGIVEFDNTVCIGCKACMQACPYDAIYIDPETDTAAKCHYCAHRTDIGLEPACVVVCPEHAIIAGDINDPDSEISRLLARQKVTVRKPEQGTAPKLFYIDGNEATLHPTATERVPQTFMWADTIPLHSSPNGRPAANGHASPQRSATARPRNNPQAHEQQIRVPQPQGQPWDGPIQFGKGRMSEHMVQVSYNAQHHVPWHWPVPAYLVTKAVGAGLFMILGLGWGLNLIPFDAPTAIAGGFLSLLLIAITTGLLVYDLEKPERFLYILLRPQLKSWLARGAIILIGFSIVAGIWWLLETIAAFGPLSDLTATLRPVLLWLGLPFALFSAIYTAFLFAQAEGRDLWQSPLLPFHLLVQSLMAGSGLLLLLDLFIVTGAIASFAAVVFVTATLVDLFITLAGEFGVAHASEVAATAAHEIRQGHYRNHFWMGSIVLGHLLPLLFMAFWTSVPALGAVAAIAAVAGLYLFEYAFVMAPQEIPNS